MEDWKTWDRWLERTDPTLLQQTFQTLNRSLPSRGNDASRWKSAVPTYIQPFVASILRQFPTLRYFFYMNEQYNGLFVAQSTIPNAGDGVFAFKPFESEIQLAPFLGYHVNESTWDAQWKRQPNIEAKKSNYIISYLDRHQHKVVIDPTDGKGDVFNPLLNQNVVPFVNEPPQGKQANTYFYETETDVWLVSCQSLARFQEVWCHYGRERDEAYLVGKPCKLSLANQLPYTQPWIIGRTLSVIQEQLETFLESQPSTGKTVIYEDKDELDDLKRELVPVFDPATKRWSWPGFNHVDGEIVAINPIAKGTLIRLFGIPIAGEDEGKEPALTREGWLDLATTTPELELADAIIQNSGIWNAKWSDPLQFLIVTERLSPGDVLRCPPIP